MQSFTENFNFVSSLGAIFMMIGSLSIVFALFFRKKVILSFVEKKVLWVGFFISLICLLGSLVYSNIIGYPPCALCWWARILIYPQVILFAVALYKKDFSVITYSLILSGLGILISGYHYLTEVIGYSPLPCSAVGVSCLTRNVFEFGFVTIPFMVLSAFILLFIVMLSTTISHKNLSK